MTKKKKIIIGIIIGIVLLGIAVFAGIYIYSQNNRVVEVTDWEKINEIDCNYKHVSLPIKYREIGKINNGLAIVKQDMGYGEDYVLLNKYGMGIIDEHNDIRVLKDNILAERNNRKWRIFDLTGKKLNQNEYDNIEYRRENDELFKVTFNGKKGVLNKEGKEIASCIYDDIKFSDNWNFIVKQGGKYGLKNKNGNDLITCMYDNIEEVQLNNENEYEDGEWFYKILLNGKYGLNNIDNGEAIFSCDYEEIKRDIKEKYKIKKNGKYGIGSNSGKEIIPCKYEDVIVIGENIYGVKSSLGWQLLNKDNKLIDNNIYEEITKDIEDNWLEREEYLVAYLKLNGKIGIISEDLNINVPCKYLKYGYNDKIYIHMYNYIIVNNNSKVGLIDKKGNIILSFKYDEIKDKVFLEDSNREIFIFKLDNKYGLVEKGDNIVLPNIYDGLECIYGKVSNYKTLLAEQVSNKLYAKINNKIGIINILGNEIFPIKYDYIDWANSLECGASYEIYEVKLDNKIGLLKENGELMFLVEGEEFNWINEITYEIFFSSCFRVCNKGKWGMVNESGNWIIPCKYKSIGVANWHEDKTYYFVSDEKNIGVVNSDGEMIIPVEYDQIEYFDNFIVSKNNKKGVINLSGEIILPVKYYEFSPMYAGRIIEENGKKGMIKLDGTIIIPPEYDYINFLYSVNESSQTNKYIYIALKGKKYAAYDENGEMILPCEYDAIHYNEGIITAQNENGCYIIEYK